MACGRREETCKPPRLRQPVAAEVRQALDRGAGCGGYDSGQPAVVRPGKGAIHSLKILEPIAKPRCQQDPLPQDTGLAFLPEL